VQKATLASLTLLLSGKEPLSVDEGLVIMAVIS